MQAERSVATDALEAEIRMLRGSLESLALADEVSCPQKMAAVAKVALSDSRERIALSEFAESRSLVSKSPHPPNHQEAVTP